jgi:hypothetical protein
MRSLAATGRFSIGLSIGETGLTCHLDLSEAEASALPRS